MSTFSTFFFFNDTATTEIYTLSLHDALPISFPSWRSLQTMLAPSTRGNVKPVAEALALGVLPLQCGHGRNVGTHGPPAHRWAPPGRQTPQDPSTDFEQVLQLAIELCRLVPQKRLDVRARQAAALVDRDDVSDLGQRQTQASRPLHEAKHLDGLVPVQAVALCPSPR